MSPFDKGDLDPLAFENCSTRYVNGEPFYEVVDSPGDDEVTELESN